MIIAAIHQSNTAQLASVMAEMEAMGAPTIRVAQVDGDLHYALEGVHRLEAAARLGLTPTVIVLDDDDEIEHDMDDCDSTVVADVLEYIGTPRGAMYALDDDGFARV